MSELKTPSLKELKEIITVIDESDYNELSKSELSAMDQRRFYLFKINKEDIKAIFDLGDKIKINEWRFYASLSTSYRDLSLIGYTTEITIAYLYAIQWKNMYIEVVYMDDNGPEMASFINRNADLAIQLITTKSAKTGKDMFIAITSAELMCISEDETDQSATFIAFPNLATLRSLPDSLITFMEKIGMLDFILRYSDETSMNYKQMPDDVSLVSFSEEYYRNTNIQFDKLAQIHFLLAERNLIHDM
jgi:hypothetical protein